MHKKFIGYFGCFGTRENVGGDTMFQRKKSEADWAVDILAQKQEAIFFTDLVKEIAKKMSKKTDAETLTSIFTRLNLDNRLIYQGAGLWYYDSNRSRKDD